MNGEYKKIMFVGPLMDKQVGGGMVTSIIKDSLEETYDIDVFEIQHSGSVVTRFFNKFFVHTLGLNIGMCHRILRQVSDHAYDMIFVNTSCYGGIIRRLKLAFPQLPIICFCHNVEYRFVSDIVSHNNNPLARINLPITYCNEHRALAYSDIVITLNDRDSRELRQKYGRVADYVMPLSIKDRTGKLEYENMPHNKTCAFIGSNFQANYYGIKWFIDNVAPHIDCDILIVGKGFERCREELETLPNINVVGAVDCVDDYYRKADFIISPIFEGSGMKTKTAEALMFGKTIFGTDEAFEGYDVEYDRIGGLCNTAQEFINAINRYQPTRAINEYARKVFLEKYSFDVFKKQMHDIIDSI